MSKADEMFKELGYEIIYYDENIERTNKENATILEYYSWYDLGTHTEKNYIRFYLKGEEICLLDNWDWRRLMIKEVQAINEKCKELGWLDGELLDDTLYDLIKADLVEKVGE